MAPLTVLVLLSVFCSSYAINCHYCAGVTKPEYCGEMVKCREEEECFSDRVIGDLGNVFYNSGCRHKYVCKLIVESKKSKRNQLPVCEECCGKDACNLNLCKEARNLTHTQCYACTDMDTPYDCHTKTQCLQDELCITEEYVDPVTYKKKYKMGCEKESRCELLNQLGKKRETTTCIECCNHGGCNRHLCYDGPRPGAGSSVPAGHGHSSAPPATDAATNAAANPTTTTTAATTTTTEDPNCEDSPLVDCTELDQVSNICGEVTDATRLYCPRFCRLCGPNALAAAGASTTTPIPVPATSLSTCTDSPIVNCTELELTTQLCEQTPDAAALYCPKFCNVPCTQ